MQKKISIPAAAMITVFGVIASAMTTYIVAQEAFNSKLHERNKDYSELLEEYEAAYEEELDAIREQMAEYGEIAADISEIDRIYRQYYPGELDSESLRNYAIQGFIAGTGDRYGYYYAPDDAEVLMNDVQGETDGIGISVIYDTDAGCIEVIDVNPDSPAEKAGIRVGDYISYVVNDDGTKDAVPEIGYEVALTRLQGKAGTEAKFIVFRDDDGDGVYDELEFAIERAHIDAVSVTYHVYEPDSSIGVIRISNFDGNTPEQFYDAVESLRQSGVTKLIFDVRYNPGGDKDAVCDVLDYLLPEGPILRTLDAEGNYTTQETSGESFLDMPMAVVMNSGTASAGELFAAAIKDYGAGKLVGDQTYGKGSIQSIMPVFDDGSLLKITYALYCPPFSDNYDGVGITPDVEMPLDEALLEKSFYKITDAEDNQLRAAAETFE